MFDTRVHRILDQVGTLAFAGVFDTLSAKLAQQAGFPMAFVSGYSVAATTIGEPDMGLLTQTEITDRARRICMSVDIPIIVHADTDGADASFIEAPSSVDELAEIGRRVPKPMVANMIEGGKTPVLPRNRLAEMGFQLILYPLAGLFAAAKAIRTAYEQVHRHGTTSGELQMTFAEFNALIGVAEKYAMAERFGAS